MQLGTHQEDPRRRMMGIGAVVAFHALLIWALAAGLAHKMISILPPPIETKIIEEIKAPDELPPPPPPPTLDVLPPPFVPPPEINISTPAPKHAITTQSKAPAPPVAKVPSNFPLKVSGRGCRPPEYPAISNRLGEQGSVVLRMLVGPNGKVTDSQIQTSSGYPRLDEAARRALSLCKFEPAIVGGVPSSAWGLLKYTFRPAN